ncbi:DUF6443 domain-containing protein [Chryseobacterium sp. Marseille-Q3244]|uniref:DUF6443 domain-containing protein n=1 Tax=Chryseobacterium sp. Marseille-Q3244 TaxID=2758092 RepID=UPI0020241F82|nr:DUF6443 domain-containing protein [Chryseobacterium sp. Marseille-Q3244]
MKKILSILSLLFAGLYFAQTNLTSSENYIYSKTCLSNDCSKVSETVQYFDGWGKPVQVIDIKATPQGKDMVSHIEYDPFGRQVKNYLPVPQAGTLNGAIYTAPLANAPAVYGSEKIYSENILESSPLSRLVKKIHTGNQWADKPVSFNYDVNVDGEVSQYIISTSWQEGRTKYGITRPGTFSSNTLAKNTVTDEDGNMSTTFNNKKGQTILIRKKINGQNADTYYVYNEFDQLAYVIPPLASQSGLVDQVTLDNLCYQYHYDGWKRLVEKKIPGKGWEYMVYDKKDRLVSTQDANLRTKGHWLYTQYDQFGRVAITGICTNQGNGTRQGEQSVADVFDNNNVKRTLQSFFYVQGMDVFYDPNGTYPNGTWVTLLSVNYYDTYPSYSFAPPFPATILEQPVITDAQNTSVNTRTLPTLSLVKNIEDDNWTKNYVWYDTKQRAVAVHSMNHLGGYTRTESELDFTGMAKQSKVYHKRIPSDTEKIITQTFEYDDGNRLKKQWHQVDGNARELLAEYTYNELSQLTNKKVGNNLQSIDYAYNIQGWMTSVNDPANLGGKLFGYEMKYTNPLNTNITPGKFSGNITEVDWKNASENILKRYTYSYDALNRLKDAVYSEPNATAPFNNYYNEHLTYDLNGNIATLKRNAFPATGNTATQVDDLVYEYSGNRLTKVIENALNETGYEGGNNLVTYDQNGNMKDMLDKGIQSIGYNFLDLPNQLSVIENSLGVVSNANINTLYSADGTKLRKTKRSKREGKGALDITQITDYLDGFQYQYQEGGSCITCRLGVAYEAQAYKGINGPIVTTPEWKLDFVVTAEGFYSFTENRYIYQYKDQIGNNRVNFAKNSAGVLEIIDTNNYYPFGLNHIGNSFLSGIGSYNAYKYNDQEVQETGMYDYGWRQYMSDLGRWNGIDQLSESYASHSPYAYVANNPVSFFDPDGREIIGSGSGWKFTGSDIDRLGSYFSGGGDYGFFSGQLNGWGGGNNSAFWSGLNGEEGGLHFNLDPVIMSGKGTASTWNFGSNYLPNAMAMMNGFIKASESWTHRVKADDMAWRLSGVRGDRGIMMIGGAGDPAGIFDIGGQVLSTWEPENRYLAMAAGIIGAIALRKPGLATKEATGAYYSVAYEMKLADNLYPGVGSYTHFKTANTALSQAMAKDAKFAAGITDLGITIPKSVTGNIGGTSPKNWVWHHDVGQGVMQLVPKAQHTNGSIFWKTMHPNGKGGLQSC